MRKIYATTNSEISKREQLNMERSRKIASQGMVLLKNDGTLPLRDIGKIALYGNGARTTIKGGSGSGDVNSRFVINIEQGLKEAGFQITTSKWLDKFDNSIKQEKDRYYQDIKKRVESEGKAAFWYVFSNPFCEPVITPITDEDISHDTDTALFVISRHSGEGKDRKVIAGEYELFDEEKIAIQTLIKNYKKVIIVLNVGAVIDTKFLRNQEGINSILLMSQAGNIGGYALTDILTGRVTPSGHLTSTWAENYNDYPNSLEYSHMNGNVDDEYYNESIYVGYRYFDTFNVTPAYPFGYGLSYTTFDTELIDISLQKNKVIINVVVKNTGDIYSGREVIQIYYSAPEGKLEKPYQNLIAFAKTKDIAPGKKEELSITFNIEEMASYDSTVASWLLESGDYYIRMGNNSRNTKVIAKLTLNKNVITEKLKNCFKPDCQWNILSSRGKKTYSYYSEATEKKNALEFIINPDDIPYREALYNQSNDKVFQSSYENIITIDDIKSGKHTIEELISQLTVKEMATLCVGTARGGIGGESVIGAASMTPGAAGDTNGFLKNTRSITSLVLADGPAGLRLSKSFKMDSKGTIVEERNDESNSALHVLIDQIMPTPEIDENATIYYQYCTAIPIATLLAQCWDIEAWEEAGDIVGEEMNEFGINLWLAPGMNIHRNPLCGRNYEYYSEDPLLSGFCAASETNGVQKHHGAGTTIKHFAFNNQEDNRMHTNAHIDERAIREIYLKGFEIAVKKSHPASIMSSYNLINGIHTANSVELLTTIARYEWNFDGMIMSDWGATGSLDEDDNIPTQKYGFSNTAGCIKAGNDLIMPGSQKDVDKIIKSVCENKDDTECHISISELQTCTKHIINTILKLT